MDLPELLEDMSFKTSVIEIRQTMKILLQNSCGSFCQSPNLGSKVVMHSTDEDEVIEGVRETLSQIPGVAVDSCEMVDSEIVVVYRYQGLPDSFHFSVETL